MHGALPLAGGGINIALQEVQRIADCTGNSELEGILIDVEVLVVVSSASTLFGVVHAYQSEYAGHQLLQSGEALGSHPGLGLSNYIFTQLSTYNLAGELYALRIVVNRVSGIAELVVSSSAAIGSADTVNDLDEGFLEGITNLFTVEQTGCTSEGQVVGDNVADCTGLQQTYRQSQRLVRLSALP